MASCRVFISCVLVSYRVLVFVSCFCVVSSRRALASCFVLLSSSSPRVVASYPVLVSVLPRVVSSCPVVVSYGVFVFVRVCTSFLSCRSWRHVSAFGFVDPIRMFYLPLRLSGSPPAMSFFLSRSLTLFSLSSFMYLIVSLFPFFESFVICVFFVCTLFLSFFFF